MLGPKQFGFMASLDFATWPPEQTVETLADAGYGAVGWTLAQFDPRTKSRDELKRLIRLTRERGLEIAEIVVQQDLLTRDAAVQAARTGLIADCIAAAADCGVSTLNVFSGPATWNVDALAIPDEV